MKTKEELRIPNKFNKWKDKLICPYCKKKEVISYWNIHQKIIGSNFEFECKNCFKTFGNREVEKENSK